jgi:MFS family permease
MDKYGRKSGVFYCIFFSLLGGALQSGADGFAMFLVGRFFAGIGAWSFFTIIPVYATEMAPPGHRRFFVGLEAFMLTLGYAVATYMGLAFYSTTSASPQWRGPLGLALICPALMLLIVLIMPESPR